MTDEEFVRANWERAEECPHRDGVQHCISLGEHMFTWVTAPQTISGYAPSRSEAWTAAAEFTRTRLEEIRQVEREVELLESMFPDLTRESLEDMTYWGEDGPRTSRNVIIDNTRDQCAQKRLLSRLESSLADLNRGMRPHAPIHRITTPSKSCWTLVIVLKRVREWGFWHLGRFIPWRAYVAGEGGIADKMKACD